MIVTAPRRFAEPFRRWAAQTIGLLVAGCGFAATTQTGIVPVDPPSEFEQALNEFDQGQQLQNADGNRARQLFRSAAKRFENVIHTGIVNGRLEFNTGNAYLQADEVGWAILHYLRAERLIPRDPLLSDNLSAARKRCLIAIPPARRDVVWRGLFFWHYSTSAQERTRLATVTYLACWVFLTLRSFVPRVSVTITGLVLGLATIVLASSVAVERWNDRNAPRGVITAMDVIVSKGPGAGYQRLFEQPLQPGVEFTLGERRAGWWNINLPDGRSGWIDEAAGALVPMQSR